MISKAQLGESQLQGLQTAAIGLLVLAFLTGINFILWFFGGIGQLPVPEPVFWLGLAAVVLVAPFLLGLFSRLWWMGALPPLGYLLGILLASAIQGEGVAGLTYDIGLLGFLVFRVGLYCFIMVFVFALGHKLR